MPARPLDHRDLGVSPAKAEELALRMARVGLTEDDLDERFIRGSGRGGQKVNKTTNAVQLRQRSTGRTVKVHESRSRALNRFYARRRLVEQLEAELLGADDPEAQRREKVRKQKDRRRRRASS